MKLKIETSAGGIVFKKVQNEIHWLVIRHSIYNKWTFPKGLIGDKVEQESAKSAAIREVQEEGGIKAKIVADEPFVVNYTYKFGEFLIKKTVYYYLMKFLSGDVKDHDHEVSDASFENEEEVKKLLSFESDIKAFDEMLSKQKHTS
ncbi:MAG: NUDIX domain-containing protein [Nanoarchaeota archaeon]